MVAQFFSTGAENHRSNVSFPIHSTDEEEELGARGLKGEDPLLIPCYDRKKQLRLNPVDDKQEKIFRLVECEEEDRLSRIQDKSE